MPTAPPFPEPWGFTQLVGQNKTNIINASIEAWKGAGRVNKTTGLPIEGGIGLGAEIMFGMLPITLGTLVYMRTQNLFITTFSMILSTVFLWQFNLVSDQFLRVLFIINGLAFALAIAYFYFNKE